MGHLNKRKLLIKKKFKAAGIIEVGSNLEISSQKYAEQVFPAALFLLFPETFELSRRSFGLLASAF